MSVTEDRTLLHSSGRPLRVLVTDGHLKTSLAAVRSLGRNGAEVHTIQQRPGSSLCGVSRFNARSHVLPPYDEAERFDAALVSVLQAEKIDHVLIASEGALRRISENRDAVSRYARVDLPPPSTVQIVLSKETLLEYATSLGVPVPTTVLYRGGGLHEAALAGLSFPMVAKTGRGGAYDRVRYVNDPAELVARLRDLPSGETAILQEYVEGDGYGFFALFEHGEPVVWQMHRRIWQYPTTGGPSAFAETVEEPQLAELGLRLLRGLAWNGLAMVEFKRSRADDRFLLMEINPRLWGSLDLCIASGVDFPYLAVVDDRKAAAAALSRRKASYLFVVPDGALFLLSRPSRALEFARHLMSRRVRTNLTLDDPRPLWQQLREVGYWLKTLLPSGRFRNPHGTPTRVGLFEFDIHMHTSRSYDSWSSAKRMLRRARRAGLSAIAITDHETIEGARRAAAANRDPGLEVVIGAEIRTEAGDIIGLFLEREIRSREALEVVREIKEQGGLVLLPHPFAYGVKDYDPRLLDRVDLIEIRNGRTTAEQAARVLNMAREHHMIVVGNSDAHFVCDIGRTRNYASRPELSGKSLKELLLSGRFRIASSKCSARRVPLSQLVKALKARKPRRAVFYAWWYAKSLLKDALVAALGEPPIWDDRR